MSMTPGRSCYYNTAMIRGYILRDPTKSRNPPNMPMWHAYPWMDCIIKIPSLAIDSTVTMMVDTGATVTALSAKDATPILGKRGYRLLRRLGNLKTVTGVGGDSLYFKIPAQIVLQHEDGTLEGFNLDLWVAKPARKRSKKRKHQLKLDSLLGRDIMAHFRAVVDYPRKQLFFDHS